MLGYRLLMKTVRPWIKVASGQRQLEAPTRRGREAESGDADVAAKGVALRLPLNSPASRLTLEPAGLRGSWRWTPDRERGPHRTAL